MKRCEREKRREGNEGKEERETVKRYLGKEGE